MLLSTSGMLEKFKRETPNNTLQARKETVAESRAGRVEYTAVGDIGEDDVVISTNGPLAPCPHHDSVVLARLPPSAQGTKALRMQRMMKHKTNLKTPPIASSKPGSQLDLLSGTATPGKTPLRGKFELSARCEYIGSTAKESTIITSREALVKGALAKVTKEQAKMKNKGIKMNPKAARAARLDFYSECVLARLQSGVGGILFELRKTSTFSCLVSKSSKRKYRGIVVISATDRSGAGVWHVLRCRKGHVPLKDVLNKLIDISFMSGVSGSCENLAHSAATAATAAMARLPQSQTTRLGFYPMPAATSPFTRRGHLGAPSHLMALPSAYSDSEASESTCDPSEFESKLQRLNSSPTPSDLALFSAGTAMKTKVVRQNSAQLLKLAVRSGTTESEASSSSSDSLNQAGGDSEGAELETVAMALAFADGVVLAGGEGNPPIRDIGEDSEGVELEALALALALTDGGAPPGDEPMLKAKPSALNTPSVSNTSSTALDLSSAQSSAMSHISESAGDQANELSGRSSNFSSDDCENVACPAIPAMKFTTTEHTEETDLASNDLGTGHGRQAFASKLNTPAVSCETVGSTDSSTDSWASTETAATRLTVGGSSTTESTDSTTDAIAGFDVPMAVSTLDISMLDDIETIDAWNPNGSNDATDDDQRRSKPREGHAGQEEVLIATDLATPSSVTAAAAAAAADPGPVADPSVGVTRSGWLTEYDRATAVAEVSGKPDGTFVVRRTAKTSSGYVMTYSVQGIATHSSLDKAPAGVSIVNGNEMFATLDELVHAVMQRPVAPLPWPMVPVASVQQTQGPSTRHVPPPPVPPPEPMANDSSEAEEVVTEQEYVDIDAQSAANPFPGRFDFDFAGRSIYTASEIIVDAEDWNLGQVDPLLDQLPKESKIKRRAYVPPAFKNRDLRPSHMTASLMAMTKLRPRKSAEL